MVVMDLLVAGSAGCAIGSLILLWRSRHRCVAAGLKHWVLSPRDRIGVGFLEVGTCGLLAGAIYLKEPDKPSFAFTLLVVCGAFVGLRTVAILLKRTRGVLTARGRMSTARRSGEPVAVRGAGPAARPWRAHVFLDARRSSSTGDGVGRSVGRRGLWFRFA